MAVFAINRRVKITLGKRGNRRVVPGTQVSDSATRIRTCVTSIEFLLRPAVLFTIPLLERLSGRISMNNLDHLFPLPD